MKATFDSSVRILVAATRKPFLDLTIERLSITKSEWERDGANDFRSAQRLVAEHDGFELIEGLQKPGVPLALMTPCFTNQDKSLRGLDIWYKQTRLRAILRAHGVRLSISTVVEGKRGRRLTQWFAALRNAGLKPNFVHTDKDFAEVTAASIAFRPGNSRYNHHLCLWHSLRAIDQYVTGKVRGRGLDLADTNMNGYCQKDRPRSALQIRRESFVP
ncbi:hypothetical protein V1525DRAFT_428350 [Lipomyces kononenkoae]|uniref:Uncharacterized protein n=1 Tax=Lipomyces kononenkoae TaxID=34357 RepID=A0ACC3SU59_LIPKO